MKSDSVIFASIVFKLGRSKMFKKNVLPSKMSIIYKYSRVPGTRYTLYKCHEDELT